VAEHPHPLRGGKQPRILFGTQAASRPPTFVLFTTGFLDPGYRRYVQRRLRELYGFAGTPIVINMRVREKRTR
jgi:GTP-binding protein